MCGTLSNPGCCNLSVGQQEQVAGEQMAGAKVWTAHLVQQERVGGADGSCGGRGGESGGVPGDELAQGGGGGRGGVGGRGHGLRARKAGSKQVVPTGAQGSKDRGNKPLLGREDAKGVHLTRVQS